MGAGVLWPVQLHRSAPVLLAVVVLAAGCGQDAAREPDVEMLDGVVMSELVLPLDAYRTSDDEAGQVVSEAWSTVFHQCMRSFGFAQEAAGPDQARELQGNSRLYGLVDLDHARTEGYTNPLIDRQPSMPGAPVPELPQEWYAVARGHIVSFAEREVPEGGCIAEAHRTLSAGAPAGADLPLADRLAGDAYIRAEQDSRVRAAIAAWRDCMTAKGYNYADPWQANNDGTWSATPPEQRPSDREVLVATADVECKIEVDLIDIWASVHIAYELLLIEQNAEALTLIKEYREVELANALAVLEGRHSLSVP